MKQKWHTKSFKEISKFLNSDENGLTSKEVEVRVKKYGENKLPETKTDSLFIIFLRQFQSPLIYILLGASIIVFIMGEYIDGFVILAVLLFNAVLGTTQEGKAQNTLASLRKFVETRATVIRDGKEMIVNDTEVVPGDIILLQEGEKVPADARVFQTHSLNIDEAAMTGESEPVRKITDPLEKEKLSTSDQRNMVFKGTNVVSGNGKAIVVTIGLDTVIGQIAEKISTIDSEIPLKKTIKNLSKLIIMVVAFVCAFLFVAGTILGKTAEEMFKTIVALSVSSIPEGLPVVITLVLATGVWRMGKRNALVKKLQAVEALGQAKVIAADKTGTITKNEIIVQKIYVEDTLYEVDGEGYEPKGDFFLKNKKLDPKKHADIMLVGEISAFCANAHVMFSPEDDIWKVTGDPTEAAMLVLAQKLEFCKDDLTKKFPLLEELPFSSDKKFHAVLHKDKEKGKNRLMVSGAPEIILKFSKLSKKELENLEEKFKGMSEQGLRVIALAQTFTSSKKLDSEKIENLKFIGFLAMRDAMRKEVPDAVDKIINAGIKVIMITGDHKITAKAIAKEAGIYKEGDLVITGADLDSMPEEELVEKLPETSVFARVTPDHKMKIIQAYKARGEIVGMTGDGVNDAPSLVAADLGVAMGKIGTEVAKEASDIVLLDDNLDSIVAAVEEGRSIYNIIKKVILYLFATNAGEIIIIKTAILLSYPLPLMPTQIIWLNFVTDGFLVAALAMEPKEKGLLKGAFEKPKKYIVDKLMGFRILIMSLTMAAGTLPLFFYYYDKDLTKALTISLTTMAVFQWFNAYNVRSDKESIFRMNPLENKWLLIATGGVVILQLMAVYVPFMQTIFHTTALSLREWLIIIPVAASIIVVEEVRKLIVRIRDAKNT